MPALLIITDDIDDEDALFGCYKISGDALEIHFKIVSERA